MYDDCDCNIQLLLLLRELPSTKWRYCRVQGRNRPWKLDDYILQTVLHSTSILIFVGGELWCELWLFIVRLILFISTYYTTINSNYTCTHYTTHCILGVFLVEFRAFHGVLLPGDSSPTITCLALVCHDPNTWGYHIRCSYYHIPHTPSSLRCCCCWPSRSCTTSKAWVLRRKLSRAALTHSSMREEGECPRPTTVVVVLLLPCLPPHLLPTAAARVCLAIDDGMSYLPRGDNGLVGLGLLDLDRQMVACTRRSYRRESHYKWRRPARCLRAIL